MIWAIQMSLQVRLYEVVPCHMTQCELTHAVLLYEIWGYLFEETFLFWLGEDITYYRYYMIHPLAKK